MKYLIALILVATTLQPAALSVCDMDGDPIGGNHADSVHAAMQHGDGSACCDPESGDVIQDCGTTAHCTSTSAGFAAIPPATTSAALVPAHHYRLTQDQRLDAPSAPPLLRPPIA